MKPWVIALVGLVLAGVGSTALAGWTFVAPVAVPAPVVYQYWPAAPVVVYRPAVVEVPELPVAAPVLAPPPVLTPAPVAYRVPVVYAPAAVVRTKVYYRGQPVRNAVKTLLP